MAELGFKPCPYDCGTAELYLVPRVFFFLILQTYKAYSIFPVLGHCLLIQKGRFYPY